MSDSERFDLMTPIAREGKETYWHKLGSMWKNGDRFNLVFEAFPAQTVDGKVKIMAFKPKPKNDGNW